MPCDVLTAKLVYRDQERSTQQDDDELQFERSVKTANSVLRNARAIASPRSLRRLRVSTDLILPDFSCFVSAELIRKRAIKFRLPNPDLIESVMTLIAGDQLQHDRNG